MNTKQTEQILEFDKIKEKWKNLALTEWAKAEIENTQISLSESELRIRLSETTEARKILEMGGNPPLVSLSGLKEWVMIAEKGGCLTAEQLEQLGMALTAVRRLKTYLARYRDMEMSVPYYEEELDSLEELEEEIRLQIRNGGVDDLATKLLHSLRREIERVRERMKEKADSVIRANKECMSDHFSTVRNGHICIPVKKEYKFRIPGSVIDKSSTGSTLFIEPTAVGKYYEELQGLIIDEENEVRRILFTLSATVADYAEVIRHNQKVVEKLDYIFSKGKLSMDYNGVEPEIQLDRRIILKDGRHPLMDPGICVPLQFEIGNGVRGIIITGPNTGGKTVAIKTVALNCMMAQCGLHVAASYANICMSSNYLCDIGDGQNLAENLSTFSAHITNVMEILRKVNCDSLVIMDELGSGTDPTEGMGIAVAILEELKKSGALFLVTTHYPEVKQYAEREEGIVNARMTFDKESLMPLYQLIIGEAGESCAFYIAGRLGMPDTMLRVAAKAAYGEGAKAYGEDAKAYGVGSDADYESMPMPVKAPWGADVKAAVEGMPTTSKASGRLHTGQSQEKGESLPRLRKAEHKGIPQERAKSFRLGDSVRVYPDQKIGIVCKTANEKGVLQVQLPDRKIWINHKRVKLHVAAAELYPEDYDFSIIFDTVENRKLRHQMEKHHMEGAQIEME